MRSKLRPPDSLRAVIVGQMAAQQALIALVGLRSHALAHMSEPKLEERAGHRGIDLGCQAARSYCGSMLLDRADDAEDE